MNIPKEYLDRKGKNITTPDIDNAIIVLMGVGQDINIILYPSYHKVTSNKHRHKWIGLYRWSFRMFQGKDTTRDLHLRKSIKERDIIQRSCG